MSKSQEFHKTCDLARAKFAPFCSEPKPNDEFVKCRWMMSGAHLMFVEALQNIYRKAGSIAPADEQAFAFMCHCVIAMIHAHHQIEETFFFPALEPEFKTDVKQEHDAFHTPLEALDDYLKCVLAVDSGKLYGQVVPAPHRKRLPYDGARIRLLLEDLADPLFTHLSHEIDWLDPDSIRASGVTEAKLIASSKIEEQQVPALVDPFTCLPAGLGHVPPYCRFPDMPWFVKKVMVPWVFHWKYRASWKFFPTWSETGLPVVEGMA